MKKTFFKSAGLLSVALLFFACGKENEITLIQELQIEMPVIPDGGSFVSLTKATDIAAVFFGILSNIPATKSNPSIASIETIKDSKNNNTPMMYVINYDGGGFVIVSATKDYFPILAYSDENNFVYNEEIGGLEIWMEETQEAIRQSESLDAY